ncbi:MAG: malonyl CoA-ACP transacylase [Verrucomicrobiales bacterium]|nr:malonyl CoA-ACP transacylase [Verrucomicrobiales bacterium]
MGAELFPHFPKEVAAADAELGYSIVELCTEDKEGKLGNTEFTQPALFVVNALSWLKKLQDGGGKPDFVAGHSLGEYNALFAAGAFDFTTGLKLVKKRGELMSKARGGGMAAVVGLPVEKIKETLQAPELSGIDVANYNSPAQFVISGPVDQIAKSEAALKSAGARNVVVLKVSAAFHSRYMVNSMNEFASFLSGFRFQTFEIPVIANVTARPYQPGDVYDNLARQISSSVLWTDSIRYLLQQPDPHFEEVGPGMVLTSLIRQIKMATS